MYRVLDLFSGIGGFSLGLEAAGMETVALCEVDKYCQQVLRKHWPDVPIHDDIKTLDARAYGAIDVVCGGFPCQDISLASAMWGERRGLDGERSGLWWEFHRIIQEAGPQWVVVENSPALRSHGLEALLRSLDEIGFDAEWHCVPASAVGAYQRRDRIWILAYRRGVGLEGVGQSEQSKGASRQIITRSQIAGAYNTHRGAGGWWQSKSSMDRVAYGVPNRVDRLRALGNAVVPQIPYLIGKAIIAYEQQQTLAA